MSDHPMRTALHDYAHGLLPEAGMAAVEVHFNGCRDCSWLVQQYVVERRRLVGALTVSVSGELRDRVLSLTPKPFRTFWIPIAAAAVVFVFAISAIVFYRRSGEAAARIRDLESRLAAAAETKDSHSMILEGLCQVELERLIAELAAIAKLPEDRAACIRKSLLEPVASSARSFERACMGELEMDGLVNTDTLAGLERDLGTSLEESERHAVAERLAGFSRNLAERMTEEFLSDLTSAVGMTSDQRAAAKRYLLERSGWRHDLVVLPTFVRRHLCVHLLKDDEGALRGEIRDGLSAEQADRVLAFLGREGAGYRLLWQKLKERS